MVSGQQAVLILFACNLVGGMLLSLFISGILDKDDARHLGSGIGISIICMALSSLALQVNSAILGFSLTDDTVILYSAVIVVGALAGWGFYRVIT